MTVVADHSTAPFCCCHWNHSETKLLQFVETDVTDQTEVGDDMLEVHEVGEEAEDGLEEASEADEDPVE